jgi:hypothetical protein
MARTRLESGPDFVYKPCTSEESFSELSDADSTSYVELAAHGTYDVLAGLDAVSNRARRIHLEELA